MKKNLTEIVFIMDMSGSMSSLSEDTIGGFNSILENQKKITGEAYITTVLFNHEIKYFHDRVSIDEVKELTKEDYQAAGTTALLDALGSAIERIQTIYKFAREDDIPESTMFVVTTDGMENSSRNYDANMVKKLVADSKEKGWVFLFLGADIDSFETAARLNFDAMNVSNYIKSSEGERIRSRAVNEAIREVRECKSISPNWKTEAEEFYKENQG